MENSNNNVERITFRLKDILSIIQNKDTSMKIYLNGNEINYDYSENFKDYWVTDIGIDKEDNEPCLIITISYNIEILYIPYLK